MRIDLFGTLGTAIPQGDAVRTLKVRDDPTIAAAASVSAPTLGDAHQAQLADVVHCRRTGARPFGCQ